MVNLLAESGHPKLVDLLANDPALLLVEATQSSFHWLGTGSNFQGVLAEFPRHAWHVRGAPRKHVGVCTEKVDEYGFLFGVEVGADRQHLAVGVLRVERDLLGTFRRFKASRMTLWLGSFSSEGLELRGKLGGVLDSLSILDALDVTFVRMLVGGADGDDPLGPGHLQLQVGVVGDSHELGVARAPDDGVVRASKSHYFKGENLLPEVGRRAKTDRQVDSTYRQRLLPWYDTMEAARAWLELRPFDAEEVEGLEVDDVQAAAAIHQHLRESGVDDDRVDDEWVDARGDYLVGMVVSIEGDGGVRPVEVLGHRHPCCEDLAALPLVLPCS